MMTSEQMLASIKAMPEWARTARQQIGCALDDIIAASRSDPATTAAAWYVRSYMTAFLAPHGRHADFQQLVAVVSTVREASRKGKQP